jgi:spermidine/putrescine transport system ATP-binding protein
LGYARGAVTVVTHAAPEIRLDHLAKQFGEVRAVDDVSLTIRTGEFFSLLGPSGCGKTTTLRLIGGFELPTGGRVELRGKDVTQLPPDKRPVNMVFQSYALFPHLDVAGNIAFGLKRHNVPAAEIRKRTAEILELVGLAGYERRKTNELSGGQQQRVALARALVNQPDVLLLDEPLGALDLKLRKRLQLELKRIQMEVGITFVYVTHDQEEALTMSDRIAVMNRGKVEQLGSPEDLYDRPATPFVADFIGTTNLLRGTVESVDGGAALVRLETGDRCRAATDRIGSGSPIELSVRPESIALRAAPGIPTDGTRGVPEDAALRARVEQVAYLGASVQYQLRTDGGLALAVLSSKAGTRFASGDIVEATWAAADSLVLDRDGGDPSEES